MVGGGGGGLGGGGDGGGEIASPLSSTQPEPGGFQRSTTFLPPWRSKNCTSNSRTCPADTPAFGPVYRRAPCRPSLLMISALSTYSLLPSSDESENWYVPDLGAVTRPRNRAQNSWQKWRPPTVSSKPQPRFG